MNPGKDIKKDAGVPLPEHPTPQFERKHYRVLNGVWDFLLTKSPEKPDKLEGKILVPFAVETPLSGIGRLVNKDDHLYYQREFDLRGPEIGKKMLLHFEGVDQVCDVWLNGVHLGRHEGGYDPFCFEIPNAEEHNVLVVDAQDDTDSEIFPRGKQNNEYGGIFYRPTSGIWKTVWIEFVPDEYIESVRLTPDFDAKRLDVAVSFKGTIESSTLEVSLKGTFINRVHLDEKGRASIELGLAMEPWTPEKPTLYDLSIKVNDDIVKSYFAMRKFSAVEYKGHLVFGLNNKPYFLTGPLDQGYWFDGGLTASSDEALVDDIWKMKCMGFNTLRKHIKIEPMRWYYHCDRLGMIVMQDFVNGGAKYKKFLINTAPFITYHFNDTRRYKLLGRGNRESRKRFEKDLRSTINLLYNCPCVAIWTLFNEGWGQFDSALLTKILKDLDPTRLVDSTSGWYDHKVGDFYSRHIYFRPVKIRSDHKRILSLTEFGGYTLSIKGHTYTNKKPFGYKTFRNASDLEVALAYLYKEQVEPLIEKEGLSIAIYTQLSDVEDELNGLLTYDRSVSKIKPEVMAALNKRLKFE
ncbi:MAG: glycoside hydrolase family 2 [Bacilli bacterium]|nr:glycoside hydrolase family 2 [Bacilli bacterium]